MDDPFYLKLLSQTPLSFGTSCLNSKVSVSKSFSNKSVVSVIVGNCLYLASQKLVNSFYFCSEMTVHLDGYWFLATYSLHYVVFRPYLQSVEICDKRELFVMSQRHKAVTMWSPIPVVTPMVQAFNCSSKIDSADFDVKHSNGDDSSLVLLDFDSGPSQILLVACCITNSATGVMKPGKVMIFLMRAYLNASDFHQRLQSWVRFLSRTSRWVISVMTFSTIMKIKFLRLSVPAQELMV